jgi:predicted ATPase with chaperone activity
MAKPHRSAKGDYEKLSGDRLGETSESIHAGAQAARDIRTGRFSKYSSDIVCNADLAGSEQTRSVHLAEALQ